MELNLEESFICWESCRISKLKLEMRARKCVCLHFGSFGSHDAKSQLKF